MTIPLPAGFRYAGVACGVKASGRKDLALIVSDQPCVAAGVYTQNLVFAAPVAVDRRRTPTDQCRGVIVNSGNANACTGARGLANARAMTELAASGVGARAEQMLVMSTGIIGKQLDMQRIGEGAAAAAAALGDSEQHFVDAAEAILTTDQGTKVARRAVPPSDLVIAGMAKGAGMIGPRMATLLGVVVTNAALTVEQAQAALKRAVDVSFNRVRVEGHTSTNDTVLLLASGRASLGQLDDFESALTETCVELAKQIPADGEGATHLMEIQVNGADDDAAAERIATAVADSPLVKTAITGNDPNWGRVVSAAGYAGVNFDAAQLRLTINGHLLYERGEPLPFDEQAASRSMSERPQVDIVLEVGAGPGQAVVWASDLTVDYVQFNSEYST